MQLSRLRIVQGHSISVSSAAGNGICTPVNDARGPRPAPYLSPAAQSQLPVLEELHAFLSYGALVPERKTLTLDLRCREMAHFQPGRGTMLPHPVGWLYAPTAALGALSAAIASDSACIVPDSHLFGGAH